MALLNLSPIEIRDEVDEKFERCHGMVRSIIESTSSESEAHDALTSTVCKSQVAHEEVCIGLLTAVLVDPANATRFYRDLSYVARDGMVTVIGCLNQILCEKFWKLTDSSRTQVLFVVREMIKTSVIGTDNVLFNVLRNISGGDISIRNVTLAEDVVNLLIDNRFWLDKNPVMIATVVYTYLRLIMDHSGASLSQLRKKETDFIISLLREKFTECLMIGRDLVRLLQNVARVPEFEEFWKDMINKPSSLSPNFTGIAQLMATRTSRRFLQCRLTPEMEKKTVFLTSHVKFGQQKRYQDWFQRQYLSTPESQTLRCDLIRFICGVIHPSNELLCSDIIPRWAVIGWILSSCTSNVAASNAKLSLFYDWLFYDPSTDNIMNIEPAILVMHHSLRSHPVISVTLLDFLCRILHNFYPPLTPQVRTGINHAFNQILEKRVLPSLSPLFDGPKLDSELKKLIRTTFPELTGGPISIKEENETQNKSRENFSDEEPDESELPKSSLNRKNNDLNNGISEIRRPLNQIPSPSEIATCLEQLSPDIKEVVSNLLKEKDNESKCQQMESLLQLVLEESDVDQESTRSLATLLIAVLKNEITSNLFPDKVDEDTLEDSIGTPLFVLIRYFVESSGSNSDPRYSRILTLLSEMSTQVSMIGYSLLYFLCVSGKNDHESYKDLARSADTDLSSYLFSDLKSCQEDDVSLFCYILPSVYKSLESVMISNARFVHLIVSCIDSLQLQQIICNVVSGRMKILKKDNIVQLINASLEWETFEQIFFWHLISAHNIQVESILPVLMKLKFEENSEALTGILLQLQRREPTQDLLKPILNREIKPGDWFSVTILDYWSRNDEDTLAQLIKTNLSKSMSPAKKNKKPNPTKGTISTFGTAILAHLDELRVKNVNFFSNELIQSALSNVQNYCSDSHKTKLSDLFALIEEEEKAVSTKKSTKVTSKSAKKTKAPSSSDTEASDEEVPSKMSKSGNSRKKRKVKVDLDSD